MFCQNAVNERSKMHAKKSKKSSGAGYIGAGLVKGLKLINRDRCHEGQKLKKSQTRPGRVSHGRVTRIFHRRWCILAGTGLFGRKKSNSPRAGFIEAGLMVIS